MELTRCTDQTRGTLEEFYAEVRSPSGLGPAMLSLIRRLREHPDPRRVFGLTSHGRLCLLPEDNYAAPWSVIVLAINSDNYSIEYLVPKHLAPWPNAYMKGEARSEEEAVQMILVAMNNSGAWSGGDGAPERR